MTITTTTQLQWTGTQQREHVRKGIAALRSDRYRQGSGMLLQKVDGGCRWCIMGVLIDVARLECPELGEWTWPGRESANAMAEWQCNDGYGSMYGISLPAPVREFYGLTNHAADAMIKDNDDGVYSFDDFAWVLERALSAHDASSPDGARPYGRVFAFNDG